MPGKVISKVESFQTLGIPSTPDGNYAERLTGLPPGYAVLQL